MNFSFHPDVEEEFFEAIKYYEGCKRGLGYDFSIEVYSAIDKILAFPDTWPILDDEIQRFLVKRFPFGIIYSIEPDVIFILSVMHLNRKPGYWKYRTA